MYSSDPQLDEDINRRIYNILRKQIINNESPSQFQGGALTPAERKKIKRALLGSASMGGAPMGGLESREQRVKAGKRGARDNKWIQFLRDTEDIDVPMDQKAKIYDSLIGQGLYIGGLESRAKRSASGKRGAKKNPWIKFLKEMENKGLSLEKESKMYRGGAETEKMRKAGASKNRWIKFLRAMEGTDLSMQEKSQLYRKHYKNGEMTLSEIKASI